MSDKQIVLLVFASGDYDISEGLKHRTKRKLPSHISDNVEFIQMYSATELMTYVENLSPREKCFVRCAVIQDRVDNLPLGEPGSKKTVADERKFAQLQEKGLPEIFGERGAWLAGELKKMDFGKKPPAIGILTYMGDVVNLNERFPGLHVIDADIDKAENFIVDALIPERARSRDTTQEVKR